VKRKREAKRERPALLVACSRGTTSIPHLRTCELLDNRRERNVGETSRTPQFVLSRVRRETCSVRVMGDFDRAKAERVPFFFARKGRCRRSFLFCLAPLGNRTAVRPGAAGSERPSVELSSSRRGKYASFFLPILHPNSLRRRLLSQRPKTLFRVWSQTRALY
jgi:hypothetical protein